MERLLLRWHHLRSCEAVTASAGATAVLLLLHSARLERTGASARLFEQHLQRGPLVLMLLLRRQLGLGADESLQLRLKVVGVDLARGCRQHILGLIRPYLLRLCLRLLSERL